jgi:hypothetical protein
MYVSERHGLEQGSLFIWTWTPHPGFFAQSCASVQAMLPLAAPDGRSPEQDDVIDRFGAEKAVGEDDRKIALAM